MSFFLKSSENVNYRFTSLSGVHFNTTLGIGHKKIQKQIFKNHLEGHIHEEVFHLFQIPISLKLN